MSADVRKLELTVLELRRAVQEAPKADGAVEALKGRRRALSAQVRAQEAGHRALLETRDVLRRGFDAAATASRLRDRWYRTAGQLLGLAVWAGGAVLLAFGLEPAPNQWVGPTLSVLASLGALVFLRPGRAT